MTLKIKVSEVAEGCATFTAVVRKVSEVSYADERKQKRARAIRLWWDLLSTVVDASEIGRKAVAEAIMDALDGYAHEVLDACFGLKSPGTLLKRYYSLKSFHDWCIEFKTSAWLPMTETLAWDYVRWLKSASVPPTKATSFMEACRFCWFVVDGSNLVESSFRIKGASNQMKAAKRPWRPADLLTVQEVLKLHASLSPTRGTRWTGCFVVTCCMCYMVVQGGLICWQQSICAWLAGSSDSSAQRSQSS